ncbi:uncharacterized protein LOC117188859 isoform X3 [Drosophila miranda]|uniref:uncharacterized protein LOC117188859 isoform X3 n=1 Tax=Drosophila miranda TaxID=7229 RepID=UPI00143F1349|nr:uncharacterized protein LOC117188859 isoform X3 [Drosophila miranda]
MMKLQINCLLAALLAVSSGNARTFTPTEEFQKAPDLGGMQESNETESTQGQTVPMATAMGEVVHSSNSINSSNSSNSSNSKLGSSAQGQHQRQRQPATTVLKHIYIRPAILMSAGDTALSCSSRIIAFGLGTTIQRTLETVRNRTPRLDQGLEGCGRCIS